MYGTEFISRRLKECVEKFKGLKAVFENLHNKHAEDIEQANKQVETKQNDASTVEKQLNVKTDDVEQKRLDAEHWAEQVETKQNALQTVKTKLEEKKKDVELKQLNVTNSKNRETVAQEAVRDAQQKAGQADNDLKAAESALAAAASNTSKQEMAKLKAAVDEAKKNVGDYQERETVAQEAVRDAQQKASNCKFGISPYRTWIRAQAP